MAHYDDLRTRAQEIRNEVKTGANTASRVGTALEGIVDALEAQAGEDEKNANAIQILQDDTEDLPSVRDSIDTHTEQLDNLAQEKQDKLEFYKEDPSNGSVEIFAQDTVSMRNDSQGGVSTIEVYNEEDTEGIIPVAKMSAEKENGDYAYIEARGNEVNIVGDFVNVNGVDLTEELANKQDQLTNYEESETSSGITVGSATLGVQEDAVLSGVTNDDEEIIANIITANEELATTSRGSAYGIVTTKDAISMRTSKGEISDVVEELNNKADKVGYYPDLKVSFAEELVGRGDATERVISDITPTGEISIGDGNATIERIKGESVVWNQLANGAGTLSLSTHTYLTILSGVSTITKYSSATDITVADGDLVYNLTLMFGSGNEPTTIEEFEARKPLNVTNDYNEGEIISYDGDALKSVGFNAFNGTYAKVIGGEVYHATGTTSISFAKELDGDTTAITLDSDNKFTPTEDGYVYAEGTNIVIHLTHSYTPEHVDEYEEDVHPLPDVKSILDADGNQLFPYGLLSAGSVHDEITATKAVKRVGVIPLNLTIKIGDYFYHTSVSGMKILPANGMPNILCGKYVTVLPAAAKSNDKCISVSVGNRDVLVKDSSYSTIEEIQAATQGVLLYYELATPIEVDLPEPINMTYEAWDFGTEELIASKPTTPLNADIVYNFNAVDRIRENSSAIDVLEEHVEERKNDGIELLTNGNLKLTLKGETREFMPATPSGDPMHYAYESAEAEYNATTDYILKDAPWKDMVDTIDYKAQWNIDIVDTSLVQADSIVYRGKSYRYAKDTRTSPVDNSPQPRYRVVVQSGDKWIWDDTAVLHLPNHWYLNGLGDITTAEMREIYRLEKKDMSSGVYMLYWRQKKLRTATVRQGSYGVQSTGYSVSENSGLEVVNFDTLAIFNHDVLGSPNIRHIISKTDRLTLEYMTNTTPKDTFSTANLVTCKLRNLKRSISMANSPNLSRATTIQLISKAIPTTAITITLHADAYARLADDADIVAALEAKNTALEGTGGSVSLVSA